MPEDPLLAVLDGAEGGRRIRVSGTLTVGRGDDAGLLIDDPEISRVHAVIGPTAGGLEIRDLGSLNGTLVNGERISSPTLLGPGDVVKIGATRVEVLSAGDRTPSPVPRASPTPVEAEHELRPVSVLFADIVGSTPLAEQLEPDDYGALIGGCVDRMCRAVEQFGGVIDAYMGDGIAAFFGFPAATEDDADRAATAALSVVQAIGAYAEEVRESRRLPDLNVRVGVNSGQVAIGVVGASERHPVALGDTMNVAARLQGTAAPGTIVIGGATARKLGGRFLVAPLGRLTVRGRESPVEAWRLFERPPRPSTTRALRPDRTGTRDRATCHGCGGFAERAGAACLRRRRARDRKVAAARVASRAAAGRRHVARRALLRLRRAAAVPRSGRSPTRLGSDGRRRGANVDARPTRAWSPMPFRISRRSSRRMPGMTPRRAT